LRRLAFLACSGLAAASALVFACGDADTRRASPPVEPAPVPIEPGPGPGPSSEPAPDAVPEPAADAAVEREPEFVWVPPTVPTSSPACGTPAPDAVGVQGTTPGGRTYHVWGPPNYDPSKKYPVVLAYHGWYASGTGHQSWFHMESYVENQAFVVYPDSSGPVWDLAGTTDLVFFDEMMTKLGESYCIDPSRVLAFGFSYGGKFVNHLGCKRAGWVKAISVGAGSWGGDGQKCGRVPVLVTHRTQDTDEVIAWGRNVADSWSYIQKCSATSQPSHGSMNCTTRQGCVGPGDVTFCEDTFFDASWPVAWNHTVREPYRLFTWQWFAALP